MLSFPALLSLLVLSRADDVFHFVTRPDIGAPIWNIEVYDDEALAPGYWFVAPYVELMQNSYPLWNGPHIYDTDGDLIWSGAPFFKHLNAYDFGVTPVAGELMLKIIVPHDHLSKNKQVGFPGVGDGAGFILDSSYDVYQNIDMRGDIPASNMHDLTIFENGKRALMLTQKTYEPTHVQIGLYNGPCKIGWQGFRELDLETGAEVLRWDAEGHIDVHESTKKEAAYHTMCKDEWDILHFNSVDKFGDGDYLVSARHTNTVYKVSSQDGSIVWRLGGLNSDFHFQDNRTTFTRQHHAKVHSQNGTHTLISLFNNAQGHGDGPGEQPSSDHSSGLLIALRTDTDPMTTELVSRWEHPEGKMTPSRGSVSLLPNGNAFIGWVYNSLISEHTFDGRLLMKATLGRGQHTYRAYKFPWIGRPTQPPDVVSRAMQNGKDRLRTIVHVSWNGATEVATWRLLRTSVDNSVFETIASSPRKGFETVLPYDGFAEYTVVVALDRDGTEIGRSKVIKTSITKDALDIPVNDEPDESLSNDAPLPAQDESTPKPSYIPQSPSVASSKPAWLGHAIVAFILGFTFCFTIVAVLWLITRTKHNCTRKVSWLRPSLPVYRPLVENEDDVIEEEDQMSTEKEII